MGLDMYLEKRHYVRNYDFFEPDQRHEVVVLKGGQPTTIKPERVCYVIEQVAYWRKANQIHQWFVDNVANGEDQCRPAYLDSEKLGQLLATVKDVLKDRDIDKAKELLPTQDGFFFGGTEYDEYYWEDLLETERMLTEILAEPDAESAEYIYQASW